VLPHPFQDFLIVVTNKRGKRMIFRNIALCLVCIFFIAGCAKPLTVERVGTASIDSKNKEIVLLDSTRWDFELKKSLIKNGFKVKNASTVISEIKKVNETTLQKYDVAETRYGINQHPGGIIDSCLVNKHVKYDSYVIEVIDIQTNETVLFIENGGWTGYCPMVSGSLFEEMAIELSNNWK